MKSNLWNLVAFNVSWFGLVFTGNIFIPIAVILFSVQLWYFQSTKNEILLICLVATVGILLDFTLVYTGVFIFPDTKGIPFWLITLWIVFAGTIRHSLVFLANSKVLQFAVGALFAPLSYISGAKLSMVYLVPSLGFSYFLLACVWGPLMLVIFSINRWLVNLEEEKHVA